jgi:hypothetical protein
MTALLLLLAVAAAPPVEVRAWSAANVPAGTTLVAAGASGGVATLRLTNPGPSALRVTLAEFRGSALKTQYWAVRGRVRTEGVVGQGFLEMWSTFPDGSSFFSRTLAPPGGPLGNLEGTQGWRSFMLPFQSAPGFAPPALLTVNVVLPGKGTVELGALELYALDSPAGLLSTDGGWLTGPQVGVAGGIAGSLLGLLGAAVGWLSARGRARSFVLGALAAALAAGVVALGAAALAVWTGQPRVVWLTLGVIGGIATLMPMAAWRGTAARYRELELRRMRAIDA